MPQGVLQNLKHEKFCHLVALENVAPVKAFAALRPGGGMGAPSCKKLMAQITIQKRIETLLQRAARRSELTHDGIIAEIQEEAKLARLAGQHAAALKGLEMLGRELHNMFVHKIDVTRHDEFSGMSEEELRGFILSQMAELGINSQKLIEGKAEQQTEEVAGYDPATSS